ncbi:MAG: PhzF family phenazine biosynthesis protein [Acidobacteriota bacterium]|nr:PhzF family phenazine biosynthesis protein [Acidobacteriota bacterium]
MKVTNYIVTDVFSTRSLAGNPLAVVFDDFGMSTEIMQSIAREFNLSETTFVQRRDPAIEAEEGVRVRIFTTQEELPFAGHPTLGTASILRTEAPETVRDNEVRLALNVGTVPVRFTPDSAYGEMTQKDPEFKTELDRETVASLIGLHADDLNPHHAPQVVSTGTAFAIVLLNSADALARLHVAEQEASPWLRKRGARWFYVLAPTGTATTGEPDFRARMQFNGGEDPATGSAAGCAISYLVQREIVQSDRRIHLRQGVEMLRPSEIFLTAHRDTAKVSNVRVGGSTVLVAKGQLFLP